jgi:dipeptidyl aminopeptidase/acylaminoacyl peptidase
LRTSGASDILFTTAAPQTDGGSFGTGRIDPAAGTIVAPNAVPERRFPSSWGFPHDPIARLVPSPDGRALAVEEGDLGLAGCGDPILLLADGGAVRPFPTGPFELVTDLAWAPDGSALYGVRRATVDRDGRPFFKTEEGEVFNGPGVVVRWDTATGAVTTIAGPCGTCGALYVAPDGRHLATATRDGEVLVHSVDAGWRSVATGTTGLAGWADAGAMITLDGRRIDLDGRTLASWDAPCCHGTGYSGPLSPDGSTMAGMTLSDDFGSWRVTLLDTSDGSTREIWEPRPRRVGDRPVPTQAGSTTGPVPGGYAQVAAWAPDGSAVVVVEPTPDSTDATLWVVPVDGSGPSAAIAITVPDMSATLGFPNVGPSVVWLPGG